MSFTFSRRLQKAMIAKNISASELARRVEVTPTAVWNWQQGNTLPRPQTFTALASALNVTEDWLRDGDAPESNAPTSVEVAEPIAQMVENLRVDIARLTGYAVEHVRVTVELATR